MLTESISSSNGNPSHFGLLRYTDIHFTNDSDDFYNQVCLLQIELHIAFALLRSVTALENLHDFPNRSHAKLKPMETWSPVLPLA